MSLRKGTRNHRIFPSEDAVYKVVYLAMFHYCQKVDHAHSPLGTSIELLCNALWGAFSPIEQNTYTKVLTDSI